MATRANQFLPDPSRKAAIDIIDPLRTRELNPYLDIPRIVVAGDQSSGKSSSLQAIFGVNFPVNDNDNIGTRFTTELILRRDHELNHCEVSIIPCEDSSDEDKRRLSEYRRTEVPENDIGRIIEEAKELIKAENTEPGVSKDVLRIDICGPSQPHLAIVDLPGLFSPVSESPPTLNTLVVNPLFQSYLKNPLTIILAVVSAKSGLTALNVAAALTTQIDPSGARILGLITKPDTLVEGSESEQQCFDLAQNDTIPFGLGWHVLRNRDSNARDSTDEDRDRVETELFCQGIWSAIPNSQKGISSLRINLRNILNDHIWKQLPNMISQIKPRLRNCLGALEKLNTQTPEELRRYLFQASRQFLSITKAAVTGNYYQHDFFRATTEASEFSKRFRARVQNDLALFASRMEENGQANEKFLSQQDYLDHELPGNVDPLIIGELFRERSKMWRDIATDYSVDIFQAAALLVKTVLAFVLGEGAVKESIWKGWVDPNLNRLKQDLNEQVDRIIRSCESGHLITYNPYLTESIQKNESERHKQRVRHVLEVYVGKHENIVDLRFDEISDQVAAATESDMKTQACLSAIDGVEAYYKVAFNQFIDEFSRLAIESCLVAKLPNLFTPEMVVGMDDAVLKCIAGESQEMTPEKATLTRRKQMLQDALEGLEKLIIRNIPHEPEHNGSRVRPRVRSG
ncbi:P-loop containing nucleoside triphosphate hydrolase protein [Xylariaceae sp. AK1471]|nr:P-loop containing nucleoside triphosphate hydrolase protein [Xylariaceae sp. AK1471]